MVTLIQLNFLVHLFDSSSCRPNADTSSLYSWIDKPAAVFNQCFVDCLFLSLFTTILTWYCMLHWYRVSGIHFTRSTLREYRTAAATPSSLHSRLYAHSRIHRKRVLYTASVRSESVPVTCTAATPAYQQLAPALMCHHTLIGQNPQVNKRSRVL